MKKVHDVAGTINDLTTTYAYNGDDELLSQGADPNSDGVPDTSTATTNVYDANGSQTTSTTGSNVTTYAYDLRNKMTSVTNGSTTVASYVYDDSQNRVREAAGGTTTYYLTDTKNPTGYSQPIEEKSSATAAPSLTYILGDRVLGQVSSTGTPTYLQTDGHGSTRLLTNSSGVVTSALNYDAFGGALNFNAGMAATPFLFGGDAVYDPASAFYLHGNGIRERAGFVFVEADATGYGTRYQPITLHLYAYVGCNPISFSDPSGHDALSDQAFMLAQVYEWSDIAIGAAMMTVGLYAGVQVMHATEDFLVRLGMEAGFSFGFPGVIVFGGVGVFAGYELWKGINGFPLP